jgi:hypothetical protein
MTFTGLTPTPYTREFAIVDNNGYLFQFGQDIDAGA